MILGASSRYLMGAWTDRYGRLRNSRCLVPGGYGNGETVKAHSQQPFDLERSRVVRDEALHGKATGVTNEEGIGASQGGAL